MTRWLTLLALSVYCSPLAECASKDASRRGDTIRADERVVVQGELTADDDLSDGARYDAIVTRTWAPGETVRVRMESRTFDTVARIVELVEERAYENDDDSGDDAKAAAYVSYIEQTNTTGRPLEIEIRASAYCEDDLGAYRMWYAFGPAATSDPIPADESFETETPEASGERRSCTLWSRLCVRQPEPS